MIVYEQDIDRKIHENLTFQLVARLRLYFENIAYIPKIPNHETQVCW
jgi:hypothetical protein